MSDPNSSVEHLPPSAQQAGRSYSPAVVARGGRTIYLAGQTAIADADGNSLVGNFAAQARRIFALLDATLQRAGGTLHNMVTMTVFISDPRDGDAFVELRKEFFPVGKFPCSALISVANFARPGMLIEIQGIAVIAD